MNSLDQIIILSAMLLLLSVVASKAMSRTGVPALLIFLVIGMLAGTDGIGGIPFDDYRLAQGLGIVSLIFILFSGGLDTSWANVKPVWKSGVILSSLGVLLSTFFVGVFSFYFLGFSFLEGLLLGAIVSSTDAAAVFSVLRSRGVSLKAKIKPLLEFESGSNDPMAVFLTIVLVGLLADQAASVASLVPSFIQQMAVGGLIGLALGKGISILINKLKLEYEGLYPVLSIAVMLLTYGVAQLLGGNGFLAVYVAGVFLGSKSFIHKKSLMRFHDGLAWMMQITMFLLLGLLVFPSELIEIGWGGVALSLFVVFVARPLSVYLGLMRSGFSFREKTMIGWVGLRGAVPIILATFPLLAGVPEANKIFNLVFFIVFTSVLLQGTSIPFVARLLKVDAPFRPAIQYPLEYNSNGDLKNELTEVSLEPNSPVIGKTIVELDLPADALVVLLHRHGDMIVPRGATQMEANDTLLIFSAKTGRKTIQEIFQA